MDTAARSDNVVVRKGVRATREVDNVVKRSGQMLLWGENVDTAMGGCPIARRGIKCKTHLIQM